MHERYHSHHYVALTVQAHHDEEELAREKGPRVVERPSMEAMVELFCFYIW